MNKNLIKISTIGMSREDWLAERRKSIGGSDCAAILGMNEYSSPYSVWADKLGLTPDREDNEAMRIGRDLEDYVAKRFTEATGKKVRRENAIIRNPEMPYLHANVDRVIVGEDAVLECKTVSSINIKQYRNGEFPDRFYAQCCEYMLVCGFRKAYLAVLILGKDFKVFEIERDDEELESLRKACESFWRYVETNTPPPTDGTDSTSGTISMLFKESDGSSCDISAYDSDLSQYMSLAAQIKELKELQDGYANAVKAFMANSSSGESARFRVSWKSAERSTFDHKRFAGEHPDIDLSNYYNTTTSRTFRVTERKE